MKSQAGSRGAENRRKAPESRAPPPSSAAKGEGRGGAFHISAETRGRDANFHRLCKGRNTGIGAQGLFTPRLFPAALLFAVFFPPCFRQSRGFPFPSRAVRAAFSFRPSLSAFIRLCPLSVSSSRSAFFILHPLFRHSPSASAFRPPSPSASGARPHPVRNHQPSDTDFIAPRTGAAAGKSEIIK